MPSSTSARVATPQPREQPSQNAATKQVRSLSYVTDPEVRTLFVEAQNLFKLGQVREGFSLAEKALELSRQGTNETQTAQIMIGLGYTYALAADNETARTYWNRGLKIATELGSQELEAEALVGNATLFTASGQPQRAEQLLTRAIAIARKISNLHLLTRALNNLAQAQLSLEKLEEASQNVDEALRIAELNKYDEQIPFIRVNRAAAYWSQKQPIEARAELELAAASSGQLESPLVALYTSIVMARLYAEEQLWDKAIPLFEASLKQAQVLQLTIFELAVHESLASAYEARENYLEAIEHWTRLLKRSKEINSKLSAAEAHFKLGWLYEQQEEIDKAILHFESARQAYREMENPSLQAQALFGLARLHSRERNHSALLGVADEVLAVADKLQISAWKIAAWYDKGSVLLDLGKNQEAIKALENGWIVSGAVEAPTQEEKRQARDLLNQLARAYWLEGRVFEGSVALAKVVAQSRELGDGEIAKGALEAIERVLKPQQLLSSVERLYEQGQLESEAHTYTILALYYDLKSQQGACPRFS